MSNITYDYYRIFYYVAKYKSFSRAADILMSNQPNITRTMNNLESQLNCKLFVRSNRGVYLTPEGEQLFSHVSVAYEQLNMAELELAKNKSLQSGIVSIGISATALHSIFLPVLERFHTDFPGIRLRLSNFTTPQAVRSLQRGIADFAIATTPFHIDRSIRQTPLKFFREVLIGGRYYQEFAREAHHLSELESFPFICLHPGTATYESQSGFFLNHNLELKPDIEVGTTDQLLMMVKSNLGIGFIPKDFIKAKFETGEIVSIPLKEQIPRRSICLLEDKSRPLSIAANALKKFLLKELGL